MSRWGEITGTLSHLQFNGLLPKCSRRLRIQWARSLLSKIGFSTQRRKGRRETNFLFGGEPLDKLKALSKAEGRPQNKKASVTLG
jgi:hypothetical protein